MSQWSWSPRKNWESFKMHKRKANIMFVMNICKLCDFMKFLLKANNTGRDYGEIMYLGSDFPMKKTQISVC